MPNESAQSNQSPSYVVSGNGESVFVDILPECYRNLNVVKEFYRVGCQRGVRFHYLFVHMLVPKSGLNGESGWIGVTEHAKKVPPNGVDEDVQLNVYVKRPAIIVGGAICTRDSLDGFVQALSERGLRESKASNRS